MLLIRAVFIEILLSLHVVGGAVIFRRFFPRESPWLGFLVPIFALLIPLNFLEHFIALPNLGWLLPLTLGVVLWALLTPGYSWEGLRFPTLLFLVLFAYSYAVRCLWPEISNATESISNLVRILNYSLGGTLPPRDSFMSGENYGGYYALQHYGAAILKRLFSLDLGTAYNLGYTFLLAWLCLMGAGAAYSISGKIWITLATLVLLLSASSGSMIFILLFNPHGFDYILSTNLNNNWQDPEQNPFTWLGRHDPYHPNLMLQPPAINFYWSEFHATIGGNFVTLATVMVVSEVFKPHRTNWPWICLALLPLIIIVTSVWFFFIVFSLCAGSITIALLAGRRPENWDFVIMTVSVAGCFLWPFVYSILSSSSQAEFRWANADERTPLWVFLIQWWPAYLPWIALLFVWPKLDLKARWIHALLPLLFVFVEFLTLGDRKLTTEKMWAGLYGVSLVSLVPLVFLQMNLAFRFLTGVLLLNGLICWTAVLHFYYGHVLEPDPSLFHLQGNDWIRADPQKNRLLEVMKTLHGATFLPGRSYWDYSQAAAVVAFSENACYIAYTFNESNYGRGVEVGYRDKMNNRFYDGKVANPLLFLRANHIDAVLIWPEDAISDPLLQQFQNQLNSEFYYVDCKMDGPNNAGVFFRQMPLETSLK